MKTIHVLIIAALAIAPVAVHAQSAPTTTNSGATGSTGATDATGEADTAVQVADPATTTDVGTTGTGTNDIGTTGTGTGSSDIGTTGTGTGTNDIGSTGTGTGTNVVQSTAPYEPAVSLASKASSLRTPGTVQVLVSLAADASLDPAQARDISVPLASSSSACSVPAAVTVAWTSAGGGSASVDVACKKAGVQTVTISSGTASTQFTTK
jgi:hypothetical protein